MSNKMKILSLLLGCSLVLSACGQASDNQDKEQKSDVTKQGENGQNEEKSEKESEEVAFGKSFNLAVDELAKAKEGQDVDYDMVISIYNDELKSLVQKRDAEFDDTMDQQISTALEASKSGSLDGIVGKQVFDKLMQKAFYYTVRHEFKEVDEHWGDTAEVKEEMEEADEFYEILAPTVAKRDAAYGTTLVDIIEAGFSQMETAVKDDDKLAFQLGKQVVDKSLMKTFYLAAGALPHGYATKVANETDVDHAKVEQAEGWAFYQSVRAYMESHAADEVAVLDQQFDLQTDVKVVDPQVVNNAFVRGFAKVALHEYEESEETFGQDKSVITALEGALFIDLIDSDIKRLLGEDAYATLHEHAQQYIEAVKTGKKEKAFDILDVIQKTLTNEVIKKAQ